MKMRVFMIIVAAALALGGRLVLGQQFAPAHSGMQHGAPAPAASAAVAAIIPGLTLPSEATTGPILEGAVHNSEFVRLPAGGESVAAFVSYPDRADKAPTVIVTAENQGMSDWARAVAYQLSRDGFIGIVPDYLSGVGPGGGDTDSFNSEEAIVDAMNRLSEEEVARRALATRHYVTEIPSANGTVARIDFADGRILASVGDGAPRLESFPVTDAGWVSALAFLSEQTGNRFQPTSNHDHVAMEMRAQQAGRGGQGGRGAPAGQTREAPGLAEKPDDLPANWVMAEHVVATTPRKNEWVDVPMPDGKTRVHTWVVYPDGTQRVGAVVVLHGGSGVTDWVRGVADQLAKEGFIALVVDLSSGLGPNGGNFDSFRFMDDRMRATGKLGRDNTMARIKAVRDYAAKMPRSNGRTGSVGFCGGGTNSFTLATDVPEHNASVVFYGGPPPAASLAKANAPVLGFYGEDDARIFSTVEPTRAEMKKLGKSYEAHTYPHATHSFLWMQDLGNNFQATADAWPRAIAFFRQHLNTAAPSTR
jgi:carboxymethylenebutenolidase